MSSIDLATRFKIGMYMLNRENRFRDEQIYHKILNELPTDKRHFKVPQYIQHYTRRQQVQIGYSK